MNQLIAAADGAWQVLVVGLIFGAGLPALFSLGVRQQSFAHHKHGVKAALHRMAAVTSFAVVLIAVLAGLSFIVAHGFGVRIAFDGLIPTFTSK